jgi:predicted transcriptional regulator of viral defense system
MQKTESRSAAAPTLKEWVDDLQSRGQYTFHRAQAIADAGLSAEAVKKALQRLARRGRVLKIKDYFCVVVPLEYVHAGGPPASWFIHDLMGAMHLPYYAGLLTAAGLHGASHQQPQEFQVITDRSVRELTAGRARIRFFASKFVGRAATMPIKTPTGMMLVATPETTALDLVRFAKSAGGLDNVATVVKELSSLIEPGKLLAAVRLVGDMASAQRLGYILDCAGDSRLSQPLHQWVEQQMPRWVALEAGRPSRGATREQRWHVLANRSLELDV